MINFTENKDLETLNHSCAHMMAHAIQHIWPNAKFWVGPVVEEGFYYDVDLGDVTLGDDDLKKIEKEMNDLCKRKEKLLDLRLDTTIDRDIYESKNRELSEQLKKLQEEQEQLLELSKNRENTRTRLREFRKNLSSGEILEDFDRVVFESVVEKIIIGGYNKEGVEEPLKITFVYKTGIHSNFNGKDFKPKRRNAAALHSDAELCSYASDEAAELCSHSSNDTC